MTFEEINEYIEVISHFTNQRMHPLRFKWRDRTYSVSHVNGVWSDVKGQSREYHYHVSTRNSGSFEL